MVAAFSIAAVMFGGAVDSSQAKKMLAQPVRVSTKVDRPLLIENGGQQEVVIQVTIDGLVRKRVRRSPLNLAVVLDRSGSMGGAKLEQAKQAALMLVEQLDEDDVFSLVVYDTEVDVLVPAGRIGNKRKNLRRMIERIQTGGSTALYAGVKTGGQQLMEFISRKRINRVLLLSDGLANVGPKSNREITSLGQRLARQDVSVTTIGLGDSYNEDLMTALAEASDANYYYVDDVEMLADVFRQELGELQKIVARDLIIEIKFPKGVIPIEVMGREQAVSGQRAVIKFAQISAQQKRQLLVRCRVNPEQYEKQQAVADVIINYQDTQLGDGLAREIRADVRVGWTEEKSLALAAIDREVEVEAALCQNAIESEKTIAWSDKGDTEKACANISAQIIKMSAFSAVAIPSLQKEIKAEIETLKANQKDLQSGQLNKAGRKQMQLNVYKKSNSK